MLFLSILTRRTKRVMICLKRSLPKALAAEAVISAVSALAMLLFSDYNDSYILYKDILAFFFICLILMWTVFAVIELSKYSFRIYHKYDENIIGESFTGLGKKSMLFEEALETFHNGDFRMALEKFTDLKNSEENLNESEKGVLEFYRGRCYQILRTYPNALICYDNASDCGFSIPVMPLFTARCCCEIGDTERALSIYQDFLDTGSEMSELVRTEIGNMYIRLNDADNALKWFQEAIDRHENYAGALGGAAIAHTMLHNFQEGEKLYRAALINRIDDSVNFTSYFKEIQAAALLETHNENSESKHTFDLPKI